MIFISTPTTSDEALVQSKNLFTQLKTFAFVGVKPLIIMEPTSEKGELLSFREILDQKYRGDISSYFENLNQLGLSAGELGTIVLFPEANTPLWNFDGTETSDFSSLYNEYASIIKAQFPESKLSILLNSTSYDLEDIEWNFPLNHSFLDYVSDIKPEFIDSVGIQGFG